MPPPRALLRQQRLLSSSISNNPILAPRQLSVAAAASQSTAQSPSQQQHQLSLVSPSSRRNLSSTAARSAGDSHYDSPGGWLWGVPPGQKPEKEGWETLWYFGFWGSLLAATVAYMFKPDTSIQTWALEEARRRLEKEGILPDPDDEKK